MSKALRVLDTRRVSTAVSTSRLLRTSDTCRIVSLSGYNASIRAVSRSRTAVAISDRVLVRAVAEPRRVSIAIAGIRGPSSGSVAAFVHTQTPPQSAWLAVHNLGRQPIVNVVVGNEVVDARISYPNTNSALIEFALPQSGKAYCF